MPMKDLKGYNPSQLHEGLSDTIRLCEEILCKIFTKEFREEAEQPVSDVMRNTVAKLNPVILLRRLCSNLVNIENAKTRLLEFTNDFFANDDSAKDNNSEDDASEESPLDIHLTSMAHASEVLKTLRITIRKICIDCGGHVELLRDCEKKDKEGYIMNVDQLDMQCATLAVVIGILENTPDNGSSAPGASLQGLKYFLKEFGKKMPEEDFRKLTTMAMRTSH